MASIFAILVATIFSFVLGMLWYGPLFGKPWMAILKFKKKDIKPQPKLFVAAIIISVVTNVILSLLIRMLAATSFMEGMGLAATFWLAFMVPMQLNPVLWENRPFRYFFN